MLAKTDSIDTATKDNGGKISFELNNKRSMPHLRMLPTN
ncbi:Foldase protein PrsA [Lactococcus lactis]|nr:Foldase protein PrsA [Lactococcus lactis]